MTGRFIVQFGIANPHKIKVPKFLLGNKHSMSKKKWEKILEYHREKKYAIPFYKQAIYKNNNVSANLLNERVNLLT